jgi:hypothetical protein
MVHGCAASLFGWVLCVYGMAKLTSAAVLSLAWRSLVLLQAHKVDVLCSF